MFNPLSYIDLNSFTPGKVQDLYVKFLNNFPVNYQPIVSLVIAILIIYSVYRVIKRDFTFIIALAIFVPTSIPVMKSVWVGLLGVVKYLFGDLYH